jgi:cysteine desulfurase
VPGIVGFGRAAEVDAAEMPTESVRLAALRDRLFDRLTERLQGVGLNGPRENRLPHNLNVHFTGVEGESILMAIDDIALSSGSACSSGKIEPSYVLKAIGVSDALALASVRFGLGRSTTEAEVDYAVEKVSAVITQLRSRRAAARGRRSAASSA